MHSGTGSTKAKKLRFLQFRFHKTGLISYTPIPSAVPAVFFCTECNFLSGVS
jgi:hypothetical protein